MTQNHGYEFLCGLIQCLSIHQIFHARQLYVLAGAVTMLAEFTRRLAKLLTHVL